MTEEEQKKAVAELITGMAPPDRSFVVPAAIDQTLQIIWRYQEPKPPSWHHATPKQAIEQLEEFADAFSKFRKAAEAISQDVYDPLWNWRGDLGTCDELLVNAHVRDTNDYLTSPLKVISRRKWFRIAAGRRLFGVVR